MNGPDPSPQPDRPDTKSARSISLPKGGGAIRGIGEKFTANPANGTGSMTVPVATSPGRSGFGPDLSLAYDSGAGNGPFGFGWSLSLPGIARKTDKGLPRYADAEDSDVFLLSGAEDLVPVRRPEDERTAGGRRYRVRRYRPRVDTTFDRIERWTRTADPADVHWRSIDRDNVLTVYGKDADSRIASPEDRRRIFRWLVCERRDDRGNVMLFEYKPDDGADVPVGATHERQRGAATDPRRTVNRYLKRVRYGNRTPLLDAEGRRPAVLAPSQVAAANWMFEVVLDYGEHDADAPAPAEGGDWTYRTDPFSSYVAGFEIRTTRLCRRVLMFHHFPAEEDVGADCLVRSTDFRYSHDDPATARAPVYTFLEAVEVRGYVRRNGGYLRRSLPPVEFSYSLPEVQDAVQEADAGSLENLPVGLGTLYRWTDLHGEGLPGVLTEQGGAWLYKRNLSPATVVRHDGRPRTVAKLAPAEVTAAKPNVTLAADEADLLDLTGDGRPDVVVLGGPGSGLFEHDDGEGWRRFRPFDAPLERDLGDANLRFVDLNGDGHADVLITEEGALVWHPSLGANGFGPARSVAQALDEQQGPRLVFADGTDSIHLADMTGDGLVDLVQVRNGEVSYWPNLGWGRFGPRVTMSRSPLFDHPERFDQRRIRVADVDGTGTADLVYLHPDGVRLYFNESGNGWSRPRVLALFPRVDELVHIEAVDLLANGTACLVWSSPVPGDAGRPLRYVDLMGGQKPHLLVSVVNNLGAETHVRYAPSSRFYLEDRLAGRPWITRLPFPVHVVERIDTVDRISRNRFVTRYAYHHGFFDGEEREFRGFGMVEQWDTEELSALGGDPKVAGGDTAPFDIPPAHTKTWFHTGAFAGRERISRQHEDEYHRDPSLTAEERRSELLPHTTLPPGLRPEEEREACRALKGMMLRQEVYGDDALPDSPADVRERAARPFTVVERDFTIRLVQPRGNDRHAVFSTHPREVVTWHYERTADPRIRHDLTLEVDDYGNVLLEAAIGYGRRRPDATLPLDADRAHQARAFVTYTEHGTTNAVEGAGDHRVPVDCDVRTYELTGVRPAGGAGRFGFAELPALAAQAAEIPYEATADGVTAQKRLVEHVRTLFRPDDLGASAGDDPEALLPLGALEALALPGAELKLAFTPGLLAEVFRRDGVPLVPDPASTLGAGGYVRGPDDHWWLAGGRAFLSAAEGDTASQERDRARGHFFLAGRYRDAFGQTTVVAYDEHDLLLLDVTDPVGNRVTAGERRPDGTLDPVRPGNDYRALQPRLVTDANRNRAAVAFDALGMVTGTAVMGKPEETLGDSLDGFVADLPDADVLGHLADPLADPGRILSRATTRLVYDLFAYHRTRDSADPEPAVVAIAARETHDAGAAAGGPVAVRHTLAYSDGFSREIQQKQQAEPGPAQAPRWTATGWTVFNNKGKPVREYEPFFTATHRFQFGLAAGVSAIAFYDSLGRVVVTLRPDHGYEKVRFDPWRRVSWDANDTVLGDPRTDPDTSGYTALYFANLGATRWDTWHALRSGGALGPEERAAAEKAAAHAGTPSTEALDALGRPFLTIEHNRVACPGHDLDGTESRPATRVEVDVEGHQRAVRDAVVQEGDPRGRIVMRYDYDLLGTRVHEASMDSGERWVLGDATGNPLATWHGRGHAVRFEYDALRRPLRTFVTGADPEQPDREVLVERLCYGEQHPQAEARNLRARVHLTLDQAGSLTTDECDFKGNPLSATRRIATEYDRALDWTGVEGALGPGVLDLAALEAAVGSRLEPRAYTSRTAFDALDRPVELTTPQVADAAPPTRIRPGYNEAGLLDRVAVSLHGDAAWTSFVDDVEYDAKGRRTLIRYGNGARTSYAYDPLTLRLVGLDTRRAAGDCPEAPPAGWPGCGLQRLRYTYDPVGNVTHVRDGAQQAIFFRNRRVEPGAAYTYDSQDRLVEATGREHLGQAGGAPSPHAPGDAGRAGVASRDQTGRFAPNDGQAFGAYVERYVYDAVGNVLQLGHRGSDPAHPGWTQRYEYADASPLEPAKRGNRLSRTITGGADPIVHRFAHDAHGNIIRLAHLGVSDPEPNLHWTHRDQIQRADLGGGGTAYYAYDASGERVRKVVEKAPGLVEERLYLGGVELFRRRHGADTLERETLHVMDDERRIALVETRVADTADADAAPARLTRYQIGDHLDSAVLELDENAAIVSYEEYTPYGSTAYQAVRSQTEAPKRYRYTGMERDEETGLGYHGARYYASWLGRWTSPDPLGLEQGVDPYVYGLNNPCLYRDPTGRKNEPDPTQYTDFGDFWNAFPYPASEQFARSLWETEADEIVTEQEEEYQEEVTEYVEETYQEKEESGVRYAAGLAFAGMGADVMTPEPTDLAVPKWVVYAGVAALAGITLAVTSSRTVTKTRTVPRVTTRTRRRRAPLTYITYTLRNPISGEIYVGRSVGYGTPHQVMMARYASHHMRALGFGDPKLDRSAPSTRSYARRHSDPSYRAIRGREQMVMDAFGGPWSERGRFNTQSGNAIRGIGLANHRGAIYLSTALALFGPVSTAEILLKHGVLPAPVP